MSRRLLAALVAAVVVFAWGAVSWLVLPFKKQVIHPMPNEAAVVSVLKSEVKSTGVYVLPHPPHDPTNPSAVPTAEEISAFTKRHQEGPLVLLFYRAQGANAMDPMVYVKGFGLNLACACMVVVIVGSVSRAGWGYLKRWLTVVLIAMFAVASSDLMQWNYWRLPTEYTLLIAADTLIAWSIAGVFIAGMLKAPTVH